MQTAPDNDLAGLNGLNVLNDWNVFFRLRSMMGRQRARIGDFHHFTRQRFHKLVAPSLG